MGAKSSKTANKKTKNNNEDLKKVTSKGQKAKPKAGTKKKLDKPEVKTLKTLKIEPSSIDKPVTPKLEKTPNTNCKSMGSVVNPDPYSGALWIRIHACKK